MLSCRVRVEPLPRMEDEQQGLDKQGEGKGRMDANECQKRSLARHELVALLWLTQVKNAVTLKKRSPTAA